MTRRRAGFSLVETMVGMVILFALFLTLFQILDLAFTQFQLGSSRTGLQGELQRCMAFLNRELQQSSVYTVAAAPITPPVDVSGVNVSRDAMSFAFISDTTNATNYDSATGLPLWNRYNIYYGTATGELKSFQVSYLTSGYVQVPLLNFVSSPVTYRSPSSAPDYIANSVRTLSQHLYCFQVDPDVGRQCVYLQIGFMADQGHVVIGHKSTAEVVVANVTIYPENTFPKM